MAIENRLTSLLQLKLPIIQGPFGGGISTVELTSTVSNKGGLGSFGGHTLPPEEIINTTKAIAGATDQPFAMNIWVEDHDPEAF